MYKLTKEHRYGMCIHEAAHAVIFSLGGAFIYRLAVAPEGCTDWVTQGRKGGVLTDLWGICSPSDTSSLFFLKWDDEKECYRADKAGFEKAYGQTNKKVLPQSRREIRAHICARLAGPIADEIHEGQDEGIYVEVETGRSHDSASAYGLSLLLPWRNEYDSLTTVTEQALRRPDVWAMVIRLARELERVGDMEEFDGFLPDAVEGWPSSPRAKKPIVIGQLVMRSPD